jgi:low affinity Fe/Cu permease
VAAPRRRETAAETEIVPREPPANRFDRFAEAVSRFVSKGLFFTIAFAVVLIWLPTVAFFESVDTWQLVINTMTSVLAFLLIALLQNSERRYDAALHQKIDAVATGLADMMEHLEDEDPDRQRRHVAKLRSSIKLERRMSGAPRDPRDGLP